MEELVEVLYQWHKGRSISQIKGKRQIKYTPQNFMLLMRSRSAY